MWVIAIFAVIVVTRFLKGLILILLLVGLAAPVRASVEEGRSVDPALVGALMAWVEQHVGTKVPTLPQVIASHSEFRGLLRAAGGSFAGRPQAIYAAGKVVVDHLNWDPEESTQLSLLVHELVHHAQRYLPRSTWSCPDAREAQAYNLQNLWLEEHGHQPFVRASWIARVSSCADQDDGLLLAQSSVN